MATTFIQFWSKLIPNAQKPNFIAYKSLAIPANNLEEELETAGKKRGKVSLWMKKLERFTNMIYGLANGKVLNRERIL